MSILFICVATLVVNVCAIAYISSKFRKISNNLTKIDSIVSESYSNTNKTSTLLSVIDNKVDIVSENIKSIEGSVELNIRKQSVIFDRQEYIITRLPKPRNRKKVELTDDVTLKELD